MRYLGGKARIGKSLASIINRLAVEVNAKTYSEPFCGMLGVGRHVEVGRRLFSDIHPDLVLFLKALQQGWLPPQSLGEEEYKELKRQKPSALRAFAGFGCSFAGKFFGGYARDATTTSYAPIARRSAEKLSKFIRGSDLFECREYTKTPLCDIVYCDPPYSGTTGYSTGGFDHEKFWDWVRHRSKSSIVLVSEYAAPKDFDSVWTKGVKTTIDCGAESGDRKNNRTEKLFIKQGMISCTFLNGC